ncbi:MAG: HipA N-terminal domain-containing protein [Paenibacillus sp.]|nr:HipA N-terminal domain-containing protein [Paenibacillus sp.]
MKNHATYHQAKVYVEDTLAGILSENEYGYEFTYLPEYLSRESAEAVSLTLPLKAEPYRDNTLFPFFDGLIPEGWLLDIAEQNWKISARDRFSLLLACCKDCIGNISIVPFEDGKEVNNG